MIMESLTKFSESVVTGEQNITGMAKGRPSRSRQQWHHSFLNLIKDAVNGMNPSLMPPPHADATDKVHATT